MIKRLKTFVASFQSTEALLSQLTSADVQNALTALDILKERHALQDGTLRNHDCTGANLRGGTFATSDLQGINFTKATLSYSYFYDAKLQGANFTEADFSHANLRALLAQGANFTGATFHLTNLARADLSHANLQNANLKEANLWQTKLTGANLTGADLTSANLTDVLCDEKTLLPDGQAWTNAVNWRKYTG